MNAGYRDNLEYCPCCGCNLQGLEIPVEQRIHFGATHFSRKIAVYDTELDRTIGWMCPDCQGEWER